MHYAHNYPLIFPLNPTYLFPSLHFLTFHISNFPKMRTTCSNHLLRTPYVSPPTSPRRQNPTLVTFTLSIKGVSKEKLNGRRRRLVNFSSGAIRAVDGGQQHHHHHLSPWDDKPYEILPSGKKSYLDEQDVVAFLDPPRDLIPLDPESYIPAAYLWKKIEDIPEDRRHRLLALLEPRLISRAWQIAGTRYEVPMLAKKSASNLLSCEEGETSVEFYNCRSSGGPWPTGWLKFFKKAIFRCNDRKTYGRLIGGSYLAQITNTISPLYFMVTQRGEVMSTEQPCDLAYELGDGHLNLHNYPQRFPTPAKHPYPFNDQVVIYVRHVGPGVSVGQAWQEGKELQQVPQKLCGEILMVKDYSSSSVNC